MVVQFNASLHRVRLITPLKRTHSGAEVFLGLASDGAQYWVKAPDSPQGPRTLVAEAIVYGVAHLVGAPVPRNVLIDIPDGLSWAYSSGRLLRGGIGHGSADVADAVVSDNWGTHSKRDDNRYRQALIYAMWDLCMGVDPQWIHQTSADYSMWSFDHGLWLAGESDWDVASLRRIGTTPWLYDLDPGVLSASALVEAARRVDALTPQSIHSVTDAVPLDWGTTSRELADVGSILHARTAGVAERLRSAAQQSRYP